MADITAPRAAPPSTVGDLALEVRSKNAGPFWVTMELVMRDADGYRIVADDMHAGQHHVPLAALRVPVTTASVSRG